MTKKIPVNLAFTEIETATSFNLSDSSDDEEIKLSLSELTVTGKRCKFSEMVEPRIKRGREKEVAQVDPKRNGNRLSNNHQIKK